MGVCCYIVGCSKTSLCAVIDPGGDEEKILQEVRDAGFTIDSILATHGHPDHVCGNRILKEASGADIIMHEADAEFFFKPEMKDYFSMLGLEASPPVDRTVKDGDLIQIGEEELLVIHTPGHTPGGICLYSAPNLITGDSLFVGAIGRTDFPGGSHDELITAIKERLLILPPETIVWPGHGYGGNRSTIAEEARSNPYL